MTTADLQRDSAYALLALFAQDMYTPEWVQEPPWDSRLIREWQPLGYLIATDAVLRRRDTATVGSNRVFYGYLAEHRTLTGTFALVVRGTEGIVEWIEDAEFSMRPHPAGGRVESGFFDIYTSMSYRDPKGSDAPLLASLQKLIGNGRCIVIGHSLGAAIATYLALDVAQFLLNGRTALRAFASPHPGDAAFAQLVASRVSDSRSYAYAPDLVPKVPLLFGYCPVANRIELTAGNIQARVRNQLWCNHHALTYATLLDYAALTVATSSDQQQYGSCILGQLG